DRREAEPVRPQRQAIGAEPDPILDAALAQASEPDCERDSGKQRNFAAETRNDRRKGGNGRSNPGGQRSHLLDDKSRVRRFGHQIAARRDDQHHERHIGNGNREPKDRARPGRTESPDGNAALGKALDEAVGLLGHLSALRALRRAWMPRWTATFSAPTVMLLSRAASFSDNSRNFSSSTARRCRRGRLSIPCLNPFGSA